LRPQVFLNDWGAATEVGRPALFEGALQLAPNRLLTSHAQRKLYIPECSDDLEMVVRSIFHSTNVMAFSRISSETDTAKLARFRDHHLEPSMWRFMVAAALDCDYSRLRALLPTILPNRYDRVN
jgi:hypothetical protein